MRKREVIYTEVITTDIKMEKDYIEEKQVSSFQKLQQNSLVALAILPNIWHFSNANQAPSFV